MRELVSGGSKASTVRNWVAFVVVGKKMGVELVGMGWWGAMFIMASGLPSEIQGDLIVVLQAGPTPKKHSFPPLLRARMDEMTLNCAHPAVEMELVRVCTM